LKGSNPGEQNKEGWQSTGEPEGVTGFYYPVGRKGGSPKGGEKRKGVLDPRVGSFLLAKKRSFQGEEGGKLLNVKRLKGKVGGLKGGWFSERGFKLEKRKKWEEREKGKGLT